MMLRKALVARLPLIKVDTGDLLNVEEVLSEWAGASVQGLLEGFSQIKEDTFYYIIAPASVKEVSWYKIFSEANSTLILVNVVSDSDMLFDGGVLVTPPSMIHRFVHEYYAGDHPDRMTQAFNGLSMKDIKEIARLAMTEFKTLSPDGVRKIRRQYFGNVTGLEQVKVGEEFYIPNKELKEWLNIDGKLLVNSSSPKELQPRGLLFTGHSGTGKTMGAKHIAHTLDLPLYMLNIGALSSKYFSESEKRLARCLEQAESYSPCVLLIDEAEKLFAHTEDSSTSSRLLAHLLWWLQEHEGQVLVIMTTNDIDAIPPELWRAGRIDDSINFSRLKQPLAEHFLQQLFINKDHLHDLNSWIAAKKMVEDLYNGATTEYSHAALTGAAMSVIKKQYLLKH